MRAWIWISAIVAFVGFTYAAVSKIAIDDAQTSPMHAYSYVWKEASYDQWVRTGNIDTELGTEYGELPILWLASGSNRGAFAYPDTVPGWNDFSFEWMPSFNIDAVSKAYSISVPGGNCISLVSSVILDDVGQTISWQSAYYNTAFQYFLEDNVDTWVDFVTDSATTSFNWNTRLIVIPAFEAAGADGGEYIREITTRFPSFGDALRNALENGATIYAEGNGGYLLEAYGLIPDGTVDITDLIDGAPPSMQASVNVADSEHPLSFVSLSTSLYTVSGPTLSDAYRTILTFGDDVWDPTDAGKPAAIEISGDDAFGGKILLVSGMPTTGILQGNDNYQWLWTANALYSAFCHKLLYYRSVHSPVVLPESTNVAPFAIPADDSITFDVTVHLRNLWDTPISDITLNEIKSGYLYYVDCPTGPTPSVSGNTITWTFSSLAGAATQDITYRLRTPDESDPLAETINDYIHSNKYLRPSTGTAYYTDSDNNEDMEYRYDLWTIVLFQANIIADADLNWKNILGEFYQPFKIFMTCENKERTSALYTKYVQYIPIDVPIYWVDDEVIPIIRTPGGQFVDVLQGTPDSAEYAYHDIDGDGDPDVWLDFSSFHPHPDSVELVNIYWLNPWTDEYEDIDHDGARAQDTDGDGVVDVPEPGDEIRAWRCVWNMGQVSGYWWYDPYVSWELWIDPPPLVEMAVGAAEHLGLPRGDRPLSETGYYYPNWDRWMEHDTSTGNTVFVRFIKMSMGSYEGFRFDPDTTTPTDLPPTQQDWGIIPYPRREYIAVMNLGGHEPTMTSPFPPEADTIYGKIAYETIWGKHRTAPIRVSYTYYTPLPNPLQFEYVAQTYKITDPSSGEQLPFLPSNGDANIDFRVTASTEYSLYWLKNVGHDYGEFTYNYTDPYSRGWDITSTTPDGLGDGVFGYITVTIPKGIGSYSIELPWDDVADEPDWAQIFPEYYTLIDTNPLVPTEPFYVEYPFKYELYCPQIMIPPALDDDNFDGVDDWEDDFGDRFVSSTGYLHDAFPPLDGEDAADSFAISPWDTTVPIEGDLASAHSGWSPGPDGTYGDDLPEKLGETHLTLRAKWHGEGYEGLVKINDGAILVNEEIFGGSPWVQWSHALLAQAKGNDIKVGRNATPTLVSLYEDTVYLRYRIKDTSEPHDFDISFDPYILSASNGLANIQVHIGGKEPASLFDPDITTGSRINPSGAPENVSIISAFPDSLITTAGYTRSVSGGVLTAVVEVDNASGQTWDNVSCHPDLSALGSTYEFFWYGVYPRPFVPAHYDEDSGEWIPGDDPRTFHAGWRFNPSEREILFQLGSPDGSTTIPEVQSSRRVYFVFHLVVDPSFANGVYDIPFVVNGTVRDYWDDIGTGEPFTMNVSDTKFAIWDGTNSPSFVLGTAQLSEFQDTLEDYFTVPTPVEARWSWSQPDPDEFDSGVYSDVTGSFSGNVLSLVPPTDALTFPPSPSRNSIWFIVRSLVDADYGTDNLLVSSHPFIRYDDILGIERTKRGGAYYIAARGPQILPLKRVSQVNGQDVDSTGYYVLNQGDNEMVIELDVVNIGNDIAMQPTLYVQIGDDAYFDGIDSTYSFAYDPETRIVSIDVPDIYPGISGIRTIPLWLAVPTTDADDVLELCYAFTAEFYGLADGSGLARTTATDSSERRKFTETDPDTIFYGANLFVRDNDISLSNETPEIDEEITINADIHFEGNTKFEQVPVRLLAEDGSQLGDDQIIGILMAGTPDTIHTVSFNHKVSDYYEKLFVVADPDSQFGEIKENDNVAVVEIITGKGDLLKDVVNYPNPFKNYTEFVYTLTRPAKSVRVELYTLRGRMIRTFDCPTKAGYNSVGWNGFDADGDPIANGSYIYKVIARDYDGKKYETRSVAVRMQ